MPKSSTAHSLADLVVVSITSLAAILASRSIVNALAAEPAGRRVLLLAALQFVVAGAVPLALVAIRRESFVSYGFTIPHLGRSLIFGCALTCLYLVAVSVTRGTLVIVPFGRHGVLKLAVGLPGLGGVLTPALVVLVWGVVEGVFSVYFAVKAGQVLSALGLPRFLGAVGFGALNALLHVAVGQRWEGAWTSALSGSFVGMVPIVTGNAWGGILVQVLTNAAGPLGRQ